MKDDYFSIFGPTGPRFICIAAHYAMTDSNRHTGPDNGVGTN